MARRPARWQAAGAPRQRRWPWGVCYGTPASIARRGPAPGASRAGVGAEGRGPRSGRAQEGLAGHGTSAWGRPRPEAPLNFRLYYSLTKPTHYAPPTIAEGSIMSSIQFTSSDTVACAKQLLDLQGDPKTGEATADRALGASECVDTSEHIQAAPSAAAAPAAQQRVRAKRASALRFLSEQHGDDAPMDGAEGKTRHRGVFWDGKNHRWRAQVGYKNKKIFLGYYHNPDEAAVAYDRKVVELHGTLAKTNYAIEGYLAEIVLPGAERRAPKPRPPPPACDAPAAGSARKPCAGAKRKADSAPAWPPQQQLMGGEALRPISVGPSGTVVTTWQQQHQQPSSPCTPAQLAAQQSARMAGNPFLPPMQAAHMQQAAQQQAGGACSSPMAGTTFRWPESQGQPQQQQQMPPPVWQHAWQGQPLPQAPPQQQPQLQAGGPPSAQCYSQPSIKGMLPGSLADLVKQALQRVGGGAAAAAAAPSGHAAAPPPPPPAAAGPASPADAPAHSAAGAGGAAGGAGAGADTISRWSSAASCDVATEQLIGHLGAAAAAGGATALQQCLPDAGLRAQLQATPDDLLRRLTAQYLPQAAA
ncbi:MAG: hypothetical protein J3K34DRAFT_394733 [Monoraphidium minutum]|nr:MAG: hypothetical protein J3K34DRAFT_394733 [Monoraphidium minutum]